MLFDPVGKGRAGNDSLMHHRCGALQDQVNGAGLIQAVHSAASFSVAPTRRTFAAPGGGSAGGSSGTPYQPAWAAQQAPGHGVMPWRAAAMHYPAHQGPAAAYSAPPPWVGAPGQALPPQQWAYGTGAAGISPEQQRAMYYLQQQQQQQQRAALYQQQQQAFLQQQQYQYQYQQQYLDCEEQLHAKEALPQVPVALDPSGRPFKVSFEALRQLMPTKQLMLQCTELTTHKVPHKIALLLL